MPYILRKSVGYYRKTTKGLKKLNTSVYDSKHGEHRELFKTKKGKTVAALALGVGYDIVPARKKR